MPGLHELSACFVLFVIFLPSLLLTWAVIEVIIHSFIYSLQTLEHCHLPSCVLGMRKTAITGTDKSPAIMGLRLPFY